MLVFRCRDVGNNECRFETREATEEELLAKIRAHYRKEYGTSQLSGELLEQVQRAIRVEAGPA